ncbi:MAG TPA: erythromycin esterase family protein [Bdellovibrionales bacterium]|nr:erythromycin esterase family protein [Bdellovibrionales bacterium]
MTETSLIDLISAEAQPIVNLHRPYLDGVADRIGGARVVLLGESTHGSQEYYEMRAALSLKLIREHGFNLIALESDWPDAENINKYIHHRSHEWDAFHRFPEWMWRNHPFRDFTEALKKHNSSERHAPVSLFGLDLYSLSSSLREVMRFFERNDQEGLKIARRAFECLEPWQFDPSRYGYSVWKGLLNGCENEVFEVLRMMHETHLTDAKISNPDLLSALQNARVVKDAEEYYRAMFESSIQSWNLRDEHMFETLLVLLDHFGPESKIIVWAHNSHLGNAQATQMGDIGELNLGQLCKARFGDACYSVGFLTNHGTVAAASEWGGDMEVKTLLKARTDSFESLFHKAGVPNFFLPLRNADRDLKDGLRIRRLERAVGVLYLPDTERSSHYFTAALSDQFDEVCWLDETRAVHALSHVAEYEAPDTFPTGL